MSNLLGHCTRVPGGPLKPVWEEGDYEGKEHESLPRLAMGQMVLPLVANASYMGCPKMEVIMDLEYGQTVEHLTASRFTVNSCKHKRETMP